MLNNELLFLVVYLTVSVGCFLLDIAVHKSMSRYEPSVWRRAGFDRTWWRWKPGWRVRMPIIIYFLFIRPRLERVRRG